jgi:hypothetical protein
MLSVAGSGFVQGSVVSWAGRPLATSWLSPILLTATVPAEVLLISGQYAIVVTNPDASVSNPYGVIVRPVLASIAPGILAVGGPAATIIATGIGFRAATGLALDTPGGRVVLATTYLSPTSLRAIVPAAALASPGMFDIYTLDTADGFASLPLLLHVSAPQITTVAPTSATAGGPAFTLTVGGTCFVSSSVVRWNGSPLSTVYLSDRLLTATVPASLVAAPGMATITVATGSAVSSGVSLPVTAGQVPSLTQISPAGATAGGAGLTLTVTGFNFISGSVVKWNGTPLATTYVNSTQLTASVPASLIALPGGAEVTVVNPGGGVSGARPFSIAPVRPTITSLSPASIPAGITTPSFTLTVNGTGFVAGQTSVEWNGAPVPVMVSSPTQLTASVPGNLLASPGTASITVSILGVYSAPATFTITPGAPVVLSWVPSAVTAGGPAFTLTASGNHFVSGSVVQWNGSPLTTTFVSATQLQAAVPASLIAAPGRAVLTVLNPGGAVSNAVQLSITGPVPQILSLTPPSATAGGPAFTLAVFGFGFLSGATLMWNGSPVPTTFHSPTDLSATVPASLIVAPGSASLAVVNPGGAASTAFTFTVGAAPAIIGFFPLPTAGGPAFTATVVGSGFAPGAVVDWNGAALSTTFVSSTQLTVAVPAALIAKPGAARITVHLGAAASLPFSVTVISPQPVISSLNPSTAVAGGASLTLTVSGAGFDSASVVAWNGVALQTSFGGTTQLMATVPAGLMAAPGTASITVQNANAAVSDPVKFVISAPVPVISALSPASATAGSAAFTLRVFGSGFLSGATVRWNGSPLETVFVHGAELAAAVPGDLITDAGTVWITVSSGEAASAPVSLLVRAPGATISGLTPASATAGSAALTLTVNGWDFASGDTVLWNGLPLTTEFVSATQLTVAVAADLISQPGSATVAITGPAGATSLALTFPIHPALPVISALSPGSATAGGGAFTLTVHGSGFLPGAGIQWNDSPLPTTFVGATQLTAFVPGSLITGTGSALIRVVNPSGQPSASAPLAITAASPAIAGFNPASATASGPALALAVFGSGFLPGAAVKWNGSPLATTFAGYSQLIAEVPAALLTAAAEVHITVVNLTGEASTAAPFRIFAAAPTIARTNPGGMIAGAPAFTLTAIGSGFLPGAVVLWNGSPLATTFLDPTQLAAQVPAGRVANSGTAAVSVANPEGAASAALAFPIVALSVSGLAPSSVAAGSPAFELSVAGAGFMNGATVYWNGTPLATAFTDPQTLIAAVPASLVATPGAARIAVANPGGVVSSAREFIIHASGASPAALSPGQ